MLLMNACPGWKWKLKLAKYPVCKDKLHGHVCIHLNICIHLEISHAVHIVDKSMDGQLCQCSEEIIENSWKAGMICE